MRFVKLTSADDSFGRGEFYVGANNIMFVRKCSSSQNAKVHIKYPMGLVSVVLNENLDEVIALLHTEDDEYSYIGRLTKERDEAVHDANVSRGALFRATADYDKKLSSLAAREVLKRDDRIAKLEAGLQKFGWRHCTSTCGLNAACPICDSRFVCSSHDGVQIQKCTCGADKHNAGVRVILETSEVK